MTSTRCLAFVAAIALVLTGCGSGAGDDSQAITPGDESMAAAAKDEGSIVWYGGTPIEQAQTITDAFEEKYGIEVQYQRLVSGPLAQRFSTEAQTGQVQGDVVTSVDDTFLRSAHENGWLIDMTPTEVPRVSKVPQKFRAGDAAVAVGLWPLVIGYNAERINGKPPSSWKDLIEPEYAGEIILSDPRVSNVYAGFWHAILTDPNLGPDYIRKFADQGYSRVVGASSAGMQMVAAGEASVVVATAPSIVLPLKQAGAPVETWVPQHPTVVTPQYLGVTTEAPHPNAARLFANWLLTEEAQTLYNSVASQASPLGNLTGTLPLPEDVKLLDYDAALESLPELVKLLKLR